MNQNSKSSIQELIDSLKKENAARALRHVMKSTDPEPLEHNVFWLFDEEVNESTKIYRILQFNRLLDLYVKGQVGFRQTIKWDDPFENFLLKSSVRDDSGRLIRLGEIAKKWYGQSWTLEKETDALWRIYSGEGKNGVRISTTVGKLFRSFYDTKEEFARIGHFMSRIKYFDRTAIEDFLKQTSFTSLTSGGQNVQFAALLSIKRPEFAHEKEVRLLKYVQEPPGDWLQLNLNANSLIETITFDPRLAESIVKNRTAELKKAGCVASLEESTLYKLDQIIIDF